VKIAYCKSMSAYVVMPASYNPEAIREEHVRQDCNLRLASAELGDLRRQSALLWDAAVDTAGVLDEAAEDQVRDQRRAEAREADMADARRLALAAWGVALAWLVQGGDIAPIRDAIEEARRLAAAAGDDQHERAALALLGGAS
jgi:hypothetical protein